MRLPEGHKYHEIRNEDGFVTNLDYTDQRSTLLRQMRGLRNNTPGLIMERDFGTRLLFKVMPVEDPRSIIGIANNGSGLIRLTVIGHGYVTNDQVYIYGAPAATGANGVWADITKIDNDTFDLVGSTFASTGSEGIVGKTPIDVYTGATLNDPTTRTIHEVIVGIDSNDKTRVFIDKSTDASGYWEEVTRAITCKVNDASIGANDYNVLIDTVKERNVPITLRTNEVVGYIAVNSTSRTSTAITPTGLTSATPIVATKVGHGYVTGDIVYAYQVGGLLEANGYWKVTRIDDDNFSLDNSVGLGQPAWTSGTGFFKKVPSVVYVTESADTYIISNAILGSNGQNWKDDDDITLYKTTAGYYGITEVLGTTPHIRFNGVDDQRKVNVYPGTSRQNLEYPYSVQRSGSRNRFPLTASTYGLILSQSIYAEHGGAGLGYSHKSIGEPSARIASGTSVAIGIWERDESNPWAVFRATANALYADGNTHNLQMTLMYGYQESDPIATFYLATNVGLGTNPFLYVNPAKMPKGVTGIRMYVAAITAAAPDVVLYREFALCSFEAWTQGGVFSAWSSVPANEGAGVFALAIVSYESAFSELTGINESIGHSPKIIRTPFKPKFAVRAARGQGGIVVVNEDDRTLRISGYSEDTHMDDIFPDVLNDINNAKQKIYLGSRGELLGLAFAGVTSTLTGLATGVLSIFKSAEIEFFDFGENKQWVIGGDFLAVDSLCSTPYGIIWGGKSAIWLLPTGSTTPIIMNEAWRNLYDGTLKTDDLTGPRVTDAFRQALKIGYNPYFNEIWCRIEAYKAGTVTAESEILSIRYSFSQRKWIGERKLATPLNGEIRYFSERATGAMTIGCPHGLLAYPNMVDYQFTDNVGVDGDAAGELLEVLMRFNIGEEQTNANSFSLFNVKIKHLATVQNNRMATLKVYTNNFAHLLDTRKIPLAEKDLNVLLDGSIGRLNNAQFEFSFPTSPTELVDIDEYELNTLAIGYIPHPAKEGY